MFSKPFLLVVIFVDCIPNASLVEAQLHFSYASQNFFFSLSRACATWVDDDDALNVCVWMSDDRHVALSKIFLSRSFILSFDTGLVMRCLLECSLLFMRVFHMDDAILTWLLSIGNALPFDASPIDPSIFTCMQFFYVCMRVSGIESICVIICYHFIRLFFILLHRTSHQYRRSFRNAFSVL